MQFQLKPFSGCILWEVSVECEVHSQELSLFYQVKSPEIKNVIFNPPKAKSLRRQDELWQASCFELFLKKANHKQYFEFNFSPFKAFQAYEFANYREGRKPMQELKSVKINTFKKATRLDVQVNLKVTESISLDQYNLFPAVILHHRSSEVSYWAVNHKKKSPDFHDLK